MMTASAQDILVKADGSTLQVKVHEIGETMVKYYRFDNPTGPIYTIPIESILSITFENGTVENFGKPSPTTETTQAASDLTPQSVTGYNEDELFRIAKQMQFRRFPMSSEDYMLRAKKYRKIAWYGTGAILVGGALGTIFVGKSINDDTVACYEVGLPSICGAAIWCVAWNLAANNQIKKANIATAYSEPIIEWDLIKNSTSNLTASLNIMGDNSNLSRNYGLGLGINLKF